jgi:hypothetical protein
LHNPHLIESRGRFLDKRYPQFIYDLSPYDLIVKARQANGCGFKWSEFCSGNNSGFCALQLAVLLGYTEIYLFGIDLNVGRGTHYHAMYTSARARFHRLLNEYFESFKQGLELIKNRGGIEVFSCSPISSLNDVIQYASVEDVL